MRVKKVKIGIKRLEDFLGDAKETMKKTERGLYFESIEGFRKALTTKRLELLRMIKGKHPKSLQELSRLSKRDMKSIVTDIEILEELDLIDMKRKKEGRRESIPTVKYDEIELKIAV